MAAKPTARSPSVLRRHVRRRSNSGDTGFALVAVIWSLGLITLLGTAAIVGARYRTKVTSSLASATTAAAAAESAINLGIAAALSSTPGQNAKFPLRCQMPGGERITVTAQEETGKVDLNTATPAVLARLFGALTLDGSAGARIAENIMEFRGPGSKDTDARPNDAKLDDAKKPHFTTIMQLDQIDGISPRLFRTALRLVTVSSGRPEPDGDAVSPELRELLNLDQKQTAPTHLLPVVGTVTIRADVRTQDGARFIREALVSLGAENGRPFLIREWRRGNVDSGAFTLTTQPRDSAPEENCLRFGDATGSRQSAAFKG